MAVWRFARGVAQAASGNGRGAATEQAAFAEVRKSIAAEATVGLNSAENVMNVAESVLAARIAGAAEADEILVSRATMSNLPHAMGESRILTLKGVSEPVEVAPVWWRE